MCSIGGRRDRKIHNDRKHALRTRPRNPLGKRPVRPMRVLSVMCYTAHEKLSFHPPWRSHKPSQRSYTIERSVPNPPVVKDESGEVLTLSPRDVMPRRRSLRTARTDIRNSTKSREKLTLLLEAGFVEPRPTLLDARLKVTIGALRTLTKSHCRCPPRD